MERSSTSVEKSTWGARSPSGAWDAETVLNYIGGALQSIRILNCGLESAGVVAVARVMEDVPDRDGVEVESGGTDRRLTVEYPDEEDVVPAVSYGAGERHHRIQVAVGGQGPESDSHPA